VGIGGPARKIGMGNRRGGSSAVGIGQGGCPTKEMVDVRFPAHLSVWLLLRPLSG
jgi:hypothetical protein